MVDHHSNTAMYIYFSVVVRGVYASSTVWFLCVWRSMWWRRSSWTSWITWQSSYMFSLTDMFTVQSCSSASMLRANLRLIWSRNNHRSPLMEVATVESSSVSRCWWFPVTVGLWWTKSSLLSVFLLMTQHKYDDLTRPSGGVTMTSTDQLTYCEILSWT